MTAYFKYLFYCSFDPFFNRSIQSLNNRVSAPTTEKQQSLYNDFIETFGTHYISSVIMGGAINIYTFVNEKSSQYNYSEISQEISLLITNTLQSVVLLNATFVDKRNQTTSSPLEDSQTFFLYQPPIDNNDSQQDWSVWTNALDKHPSVINRTLVPLTELLYDYPQVQNHLRRTIAYYKQYGVLPTLAQLNNRRRIRSSTASLPLIPGLDIVGCGFDILSMQSKLCLVETENTNKQNQYNDAFDTSLNYLLPDSFYAMDTPDSMALNFSLHIRSVDDYYRRTFYSTRSDSFGFLGFGASHYSKSIETIYRRFYEENYYLALRLLQIKWYTLSVVAFPYPKLNAVAQAAINRLPTTFNSNDTAKFNQFFESFGTHFVQSADMGGLVQSEIWYKKCLLYEKSETWINEQSSRSWWFFSSGQSSSSYMSSVDEQFRKYSSFSSKLVGGYQFMNTTLWQDWAPTIKLNPNAVQYRLKPIYTLLPEGQQRTTLANALAVLRTTADANSTEFISQLKEISSAPDKDCALNRRKRDLLLEARHRYSRSAMSNANAARQALCPIVGYEGLFCPGINQTVQRIKKSLSTVAKLPRGVGMTIDISTGKLMLPALELTFPTDSTSRLWRDKNGTTRSFQIPNEITLTPVDANRDNQPTTHIYPTAMQFADVWTRSSGSGSWLGGALGHSESVLNVNAKFFSLQQATAITQYPMGLYRLEVTNLTLNEYAKEALRLLPVVYDESVYDDFMDTWGTHIAVSTFLGEPDVSEHRKNS